MKIFFFYLSCLYLFLCANVPAFGQTDSLLSLLSDMSEDETYYTDLLIDLQEQPIQINYADKSDFMQLPLFTNEMADTIIKHRQKYGDYKYIRQLKTIIDPQIYDLLKPYLTTHNKGYHEVKITQRASYKIEKDPKIESGRYNGNALNSYNRIKYQHDPFTTLGFVSQKDPGENNIIDHLNFFAQYKRKGWNIVLGNYYLQVGQGLSHSNPYGNQKSIYLSAVFREPSSFVRPNLSSSESSGKFGLFAEKQFNTAITAFSFYSNAQRDAQLTDNSLTGISYDGYHRSEAELKSRKFFSEINWGGGFRFYPLQTLEISTIVNQYHFSKVIQNNEEVIGENTLRRNYFDFAGDKLTQAGINYILKLYDLKLSGEYSFSDIGKPGWTQSIYYFKDRFKIGVKYWQLDKNFQSIDGRVFDNSGPFPQGVKGYFAGVQLKATRRSTISAYKIAEQGTWRSYFDPMPTSNSEWLTQWDYRFYKISFTSRLRHKINENFLSGETGDQRIERKQNSIRLQIGYNPVKAISTRTRWEHTIVKNPEEKGSLFFQELNYLFSPSLSLSTRYTFFRTASWDSRIYEYERGLPGTFSNVALSDNGNKIYLLLKWRAMENLYLWFKWRYIVQNDVLKNGQDNKILNRDIRAQIQFNL